jgi:hypothetical protein
MVRKKAEDDEEEEDVVVGPRNTKTTGAQTRRQRGPKHEEQPIDLSLSAVSLAEHLLGGPHVIHGHCGVAPEHCTGSYPMPRSHLSPAVQQVGDSVPKHLNIPGALP